MAICVTIRRKVTDKEISKKLAPFIVQLRSRASVQPGFVTDQAFSCLDCEGEYLVISTWNSMEDWENWKNSDERKNIQEQIDGLTGEETEYRFYEPIVGGISPRFNSPG